MEIALGPTWSADGGCGRTAAWNSASHTWILGKQQWFVDSSAPASRTSVYLFPETIAIPQLYATRRSGLKQVSRKPRMIVARDRHPIPGEYAWSGFATGAGGRGSWSRAFPVPQPSRRSSHCNGDNCPGDHPPIPVSTGSALSWCDRSVTWCREVCRARAF